MCRKEPTTSLASLKMLKLLPLCYWHEFREISFFYKCMHKYYNINVIEYTSLITGPTRNANHSNLRQNRVSTSLFRDSFFNRIVFLWSNISLDIRETKAPLPLKTVYLTTPLTNLSLTLTLLEFKQGKQSALIVVRFN